MSADVISEEVRAYIDAVEAGFADLSQRDRDDLLQDLEEHLTEVSIEGEGSLEERLGAPSAYAAELRRSAGLSPRPDGRPEAPVAWSRIAEAFPVRRWLSDYRRKRRPSGPGWWILRSVLIGMGAFVADGGTTNIPFPRAGDSRLGGFVVMVVMAWVSVTLGRRAIGARVWRVVSSAVTIVAILYGVYLTQTIQTQGGDLQTYKRLLTVQQLRHANGYPILDICPYGTDGALLKGVRLLDPGQRPITNLASFPRILLRSRSGLSAEQDLEAPGTYPRGQGADDQSGLLSFPTCPEKMGGANASPVPSARPTPKK